MILGVLLWVEFVSNVWQVLFLIGLSANKLYYSPPSLWCLTVAIIVSFFILCDWGGLRGDRLGLNCVLHFAQGLCASKCVCGCRPSTIKLLNFYVWCCVSQRGLNQGKH